jgi:hypothetical protein
VDDILRRISGLFRVAIEVWSGIEGKMLRVESRTQLGTMEMYSRREKVKGL